MSGVGFRPYRWEMTNHKDWFWYVACLIGWLTEKSRTQFANATDELR